MFGNLWQQPATRMFWHFYEFMLLGAKREQMGWPRPVDITISCPTF
jgi:hypothetical protein